MLCNAWKFKSDIFVRADYEIDAIRGEWRTTMAAYAHRVFARFCGSQALILAIAEEAIELNKGSKSVIAKAANAQAVLDRL